MKPDETCYTCTKSTCTNGNGNTNDYDAIFKVMIKLHCPIVTVHIGNAKHIISFGAHHTTSHIFRENELVDITQSEMSLEEWVMTTFLLSKGDGAVITIYNK